MITGQKLSAAGGQRRVPGINQKRKVWGDEVWVPLKAQVIDRKRAFRGTESHLLEEGNSEVIVRKHESVDKIFGHTAKS